VTIGRAKVGAFTLPLIYSAIVAIIKSFGDHIK
jgi:hypothetical protein